LIDVIFNPTPLAIDAISHRAKPFVVSQHDGVEQASATAVMATADALFRSARTLPRGTSPMLAALA
jgi:serine protease inhibitor